MESRGLPAYLRQKRLAMEDAAARRPTAAQWRETVEATVTAGDVTGVRRVRIRDWQLIGDSGPAFGGWSLGPSSPELLCGVLGACLVHTYLITAAWKEIPLEDVAVRVTANNNDAALLGLPSADPELPWGFTAHVQVQALAVAPEVVAELHRLVGERCPLTNLIRAATAVEIIIAQ